jgi:hypothetical protein
MSIFKFFEPTVLFPMSFWSFWYIMLHISFLASTCYLWLNIARRVLYSWALPPLLYKMLKLSRLTCLNWPVRLTCPNWSVQADLSRLICPGWSVQADLSLLNCPQCPVQADLSQLTCPGWSVPADQTQLTCPGWSVPADFVLSAPPRLPCPDCPVQADLSDLPVQTFLSWLTCPGCPV